MLSCSSMFKSHDEYIKEFTERRIKIIERTGKSNFTTKEYLEEINKELNEQKD